jgi:hypothetical protein
MIIFEMTSTNKAFTTKTCLLFCMGTISSDYPTYEDYFTLRVVGKKKKTPNNPVSKEILACRCYHLRRQHKRISWFSAASETVVPVSRRPMRGE